jgi:hypothetical protein
VRAKDLSFIVALPWESTGAPMYAAAHSLFTATTAKHFRRTPKEARSALGVLRVAIMFCQFEIRYVSVRLPPCGVN